MGIKRKAGNPIASPISSTYKPTSWQRFTPKKCHKCLSVNRIHIYRQRNSVKNFASTLERKGLGDAVVSNILRERASSGMSNVIPFLGYRKMSLRVKILKGAEAPESKIVTQNEIQELQRDLNLSNDQLRNICQFLKRKGLHTPNTRITQVLKKQNVNIDQLLKRVEEIRGKPLQLNRYGIDHGQDWLKVVLSPIHVLQYADSVKGALLVAVANCIETPFNIQQIIGLLDVTLDHHTNVITCDLKVLCQILGIKGGNASSLSIVVFVPSSLSILSV